MLEPVRIAIGICRSRSDGRPGKCGRQSIAHFLDLRRGHRWDERQNDAVLLGALAARQLRAVSFGQIGALEVRVHDTAPRRHPVVEHPLHHGALVARSGSSTQ